MVSEPMPSGCPKLSLRARVQIDRVSGKPVLLYPEGVLVLNPTGQAIIALCNGETPVQQIISRLAERYKVTPAEISCEVLEFLNRLRERKVLDILAQPGAAA